METSRTSTMVKEVLIVTAGDQWHNPKLMIRLTSETACHPAR